MPIFKRKRGTNTIVLGDIDRNIQRRLKLISITKGVPLYKVANYILKAGLNSIDEKNLKIE